MRIHIWRAAVGSWAADNELGSEAPNSNDWWHDIEQSLAREKGVFDLGHGDSAGERCKAFLLSAEKVDDVLDIIELTFRYIERRRELPYYERRSEQENRGLSQEPEEAIEELNLRFREAGVGYQFENGRIVRVDSQFIHGEVVKPALNLLSDERFVGPQEEFLHAHQLYRTAAGNDDKQREDAISVALKAFESTLKVICDQKRWAYPATATAAALIKIVIERGLLPAYVGLAALRNRTGAHGQGDQQRKVPEHLAAYALHLAATDIVMLVQAFIASSSL